MTPTVFSALEETLVNPLAYCLNLEYNVNALTMFMNWVRNTPDTIESGDWGRPITWTIRAIRCRCTAACMNTRR